MLIGSAVQKGTAVAVYDLDAAHLFSKTGTLHGYTGRAVTIRVGQSGGYVLYDAQGNDRQCKQWRTRKLSRMAISTMAAIQVLHSETD